jgi:hypothetical protein
VFVAIIAAIMTTPVSVFADYVIMQFLAADLKTKHDSLSVSAAAAVPDKSRRIAFAAGRASLIKEISMTSIGSRRSTRRRNSSGRRVTNSSCDDMLSSTLQEDMSRLLNALREFRSELKEKDRNAFDGS